MLSSSTANHSLPTGSRRWMHSIGQICKCQQSLMLCPSLSLSVSSLSFSLFLLFNQQFTHNTHTVARQETRWKHGRANAIIIPCYNVHFRHHQKESAFSTVLFCTYFAPSLHPSKSHTTFAGGTHLARGREPPMRFKVRPGMFAFSDSINRCCRTVTVKDDESEKIKVTHLSLHTEVK